MGAGVLVLPSWIPFRQLTVWRRLSLHPESVVISRDRNLGPSSRGRCLGCELSGNAQRLGVRPEDTGTLCRESQPGLNRR